MKIKGKKLLSQENLSSVLSSVIAIIIGLLIGFVLLLVTDSSRALKGFQTILLGGFKDMKSFGQVLYFATPIIMTGLSVGFANKTGLFNIGASGQFTFGAFVAIFVGVKWTFLPGFTHWLVALLMAMIAGALWGSIPGILKAYLNVNEVIACIMMNYIGMHLVNFMITATIFDSRTNQTFRVAPSANLPKLGLNVLFADGANKSSANSGILIAILFGVIMYIILEKTKFGYELKACGYNRNAANYAGINENRSIVMSMVIAGALSGLGGGLLYLAGSGKGISVLDVMAPEGFNGIPVALLGLNNPIGTVFSGLFIAHLNQGGFNVQTVGFEPQVIEIIIAIIIYFSAFALLFKGLIKKLFKSKSENANKETVLETQKGGTLK